MSGATSNNTPPSSTATPSTSSTVDVDTQVTRDGDKTIITIKSVSTVRIKKEEQRCVVQCCIGLEGIGVRYLGQES